MKIFIKNWRVSADTTLQYNSSQLCLTYKLWPRTLSPPWWIGLRGLGGSLPARGQGQGEGKGCTVKDISRRGPTGGSLVRRCIFRVALCFHRHSLPNKPVIVPSSQSVDRKVQQFLRSQFKSALFLSLASAWSSVTGELPFLECAENEHGVRAVHAAQGAHCRVS